MSGEDVHVSWRGVRYKGGLEILLLLVHMPFGEGFTVWQIVGHQFVVNPGQVVRNLLRIEKRSVDRWG